jgi:amidase
MERGYSLDTAESGLIARCAWGQGPLTFAVKDCIDVAGLPTRQGSAIFADAPPAAAHAAPVAGLLADGGWRLVGKTAMHELAFGVTGVNPWGGTPRNPHWPDRIVGGSSSGSAAVVAAGLVDMAIGTDTGGSVRLPAACCGVVGFKPSFGAVSRDGVHPAGSSLDCVGVLARGVTMVRRAMQAMVPAWQGDDRPVQGRAWRLLRLRPAGVEAGVDLALDAALARTGLGVEPGELPGIEAAFEAGLVIIGAENWSALGTWIDHPAMGEDVRARLRQGARHGPDAVAAAQSVRVDLVRAIDALLADRDALVLPTLPIVPPTLAQAADARAVVPLTRLVRPFNLSGHPAISLPIRTAQGLPAGLQLVGRRGGDAALLALATHIASRLGLEEGQS